jgi:hypothetical protein
MGDLVLLMQHYDLLWSSSHGSGDSKNNSEVDQGSKSIQRPHVAIHQKVAYNHTSTIALM